MKKEIYVCDKCEHPYNEDDIKSIEFRAGASAKLKMAQFNRTPESAPKDGTWFLAYMKHYSEEPFHIVIKWDGEVGNGNWRSWCKWLSPDAFEIIWWKPV